MISHSDYLFLINQLRKDQNCKWYFIVRFLGATGARISELVQFKIEQVLIGYIDIYSKGGKIRRIYIPNHLLHETKIWLTATNRANGYLFLNCSGKKLSTRGIAHQLKKIASNYNMNLKNVYPHSFWHMFAKTFIERYNDIALLSDLLGHESIETTRIYLRRTAQEQREIVNKVIVW